MPQTDSISKGQTLPAEFTFDAVNGTPPYTWDITIRGIGSSGIVASVAGDPPLVTFDASSVRSGVYTIEMEGQVTDSLGDRDGNAQNNIDYYYVTIAPVLIGWDTGSLVIPSVEQGATSSETATLSHTSGGLAPFSFAFEWVGGTAPAPGITFNQTAGQIAIDVAATTPPGDYSGSIRGLMTDDTGETVE